MVDIPFKDTDSRHYLDSYSQSNLLENMERKKPTYFQQGEH